MTFLRDPETNHMVGIEQAPVVNRPINSDWPKWVTPHDSQIVRREAVEGAPAHVSTPGWPNYHVNRADGSVTVLVANEDEEKRALGEYQAPGTEGHPVGVADEVTLRAVKLDVERARQDLANSVAVEDARVHDALVAEEAARRIAEQAKLEAANREAAAKLAQAQRDRLAEGLKADPVARVERAAPVQPVIDEAIEPPQVHPGPAPVRPEPVTPRPAPVVPRPPLG